MGDNHEAFENNNVVNLLDRDHGSMSALESILTPGKKKSTEKIIKVRRAELSTNIPNITLSLDTK